MDVIGIMHFMLLLNCGFFSLSLEGELDDYINKNLEFLKHSSVHIIEVIFGRGSVLY